MWRQQGPEFFEEAVIDADGTMVETTGAVALKEARLPATAHRQIARVFAASRVPLPTLPYTTRGGKRREILSLVNATRPRETVLLNLWAGWCAPCRRELADLVRHQDQLRAAGVTVLALSVDEIDTQSRENGASGEQSAAVAAGLPSGSATAALVDKLQIVHNHMFDVHPRLPVPGSFLINARGRLAAMYKGRVSIPDLLEDAAHLTAGVTVARRRSVPFKGRWLAP